MLQQCYFKQNYAPKLFIAFKMPFQVRGKSRFSLFPPKKFYNINYWIIIFLVIKMWQTIIQSPVGIVR